MWDLVQSCHEGQLPEFRKAFGFCDVVHVAGPETGREFKDKINTN